MDDDSCVMEYIEIVPLERNENSSNVADIKCEPVSVKVGIVSSFLFFQLISMHIYAGILFHMIVFLYFLIIIINIIIFLMCRKVFA